MSSGGLAPSFVHDLETCVGCHACAVACANENQLAAGTSWRQIITFNETRWPGLPVFHLSLACNHCRDAPCLQQCPAGAISRDPETHAVVIDDGSCIGCRYCSWVCPYDAPRFDTRRGVMGKCTFCNHRLGAGLDPACVSLCPVGALRLGEHRDDEPRAVSGFPDRAIRPLIRFEPLRGRVTSAAVESSPLSFATPWPAPEPVRKFSLRSEWTLALFTFVAIALVGAWTGSWIRGESVPRVPFFLAGAVAMAISSLHLGRPERAWRAAFNWKASWLSREVLSYAAFLVAAAIAAFVVPGDARMAGLAAVTGFACVFCVDRVYEAMARTRASTFDDIDAVSSGAFLAGVFAGAPMLFLPFGMLRAVATIARLRRERRRAGSGDAGPDLLRSDSAFRTWSRFRRGASREDQGSHGGWPTLHTTAADQAHGERGSTSTLGGHVHVVAARAVVGWLLPLGIWLTGSPSAGPLALILALAGEVMDRAAFYDAIEIVTPRLQMARDVGVSSAWPARGRPGLGVGAQGR